MRRHKNGLKFNRKRRKIDWSRIGSMVSWLFEAVIVVAIAYVLVMNFGIRSSMIGSSMEETIHSGDQILVNKFAAVVSHPKAGDVVVFLPNGNEKSHYYVRRIVAGPGDTVQIKDGNLYVNGERYEESSEVEKMNDPGLAEEPITLASDEYFVLGDNRNDSEDSRSANIGIVKEDYIIGIAWFRLGGIKDFGFIR